MWCGKMGVSLRTRGVWSRHRGLRSSVKWCRGLQVPCPVCRDTFLPPWVPVQPSFCATFRRNQLSAPWRSPADLIITLPSSEVKKEADFGGIERLYGFLAQLLKRWSNYLQRKLIKNHSVLAEVDLLGYSAREWKGETKQAKHMREAYNELFWNYHIKYLRQVKKDNYCVLRAVLFQILSQGIPFPSWMRERDILKLPEKLLYSQGCNWIQQYSFGPERYTGPNAFGKLRKCMETLKTNWIEISGTKDHEERGNMCNALFSDESKEHKLYEAIKFVMLYEVVEAYEQIKNREEPIPHLFSLLLARDTSSDPLSFMMNHLNSIGDSGCLDQVEIFLLGYLLEVKIRVYRLHRFNTEDFQVNYPDEYRREWNEVSLLTEDDHYYHIPVIRT